MDHNMVDAAGWIAAGATMIAAVMTAANLGARITGTGFIIFTVGSICWSIVGFGTHQVTLQATNGFLTLVNAVGVWRWLGRQSAYEDGARSATAASQRTATPTLFTATAIAGMPVRDCDGHSLGKAIEALIECETGSVNYVVVATGHAGGLDETLRALPRDRIEFGCDRLRTALTEAEFRQLPTLTNGDWPAQVAA